MIIPFYPVVMCGGAGTRLWPLSRVDRPKQFLALFGGQSLLQATVARTMPIAGAQAPLVVCNREHADLVDAQLADSGLQPQRIVLEPVGRNTAPCAALAALALGDLLGRSDAVMLLLPADHLIGDLDAYQCAIAAAVDAARDGAVVTFGIVPDRAETGYGYVKAVPGDALPWPVERFVEKPDAATAEAYLACGDYFWNSGMFAVRADVLLDELEALRGDIAAAVGRAWSGRVQHDRRIALDGDAFAAVPAESLDYAVMERTRRARLVPLDAGWNDVGSWAAVWKESQRDAAGNVASGDALLVDSANTYVRAESRTVVVLGATDLVVVDTGDALLVASRERSQDVKRVVELLRARDGDPGG